MTGFFDGPKVGVVASSGMVRVTVHPRPNWQAGLVILAGGILEASVLFHFWSLTSRSFHFILIAIFVSTLGSSLYQFSGEEIIEIDSQKLTIRKGIHGWERKREYRIDECRDLEWDSGPKGGSYLTCKVGRWPIKFANRLSENDAIEILSALQRTLPDVAEKICTYPGGKDHFITLGLN